MTVSGPGVDRSFGAAAARADGEAELGRVALSFAQGAACRSLEAAGTVYVRGFSGSTLFRVERDDRGVVWTFTEALVGASEGREI